MKKCSSVLPEVVVTLPSHHAPRPVIICAKEVQPSEDNQGADNQGADNQGADNQGADSH